MSVYAQISWDGKRLSISGVEGPESNGDARGSCGQIVMSLGQGEEITPAPGWTDVSIRKFLEVWDRWHLNDMRPGCVHQANWPTDEKVEIVTYRLITSAFGEQDRIKRDSTTRLRMGETVTLTPEQQALLSLPWETKTAPDADGPGSGRYEVNKREQKALGWIPEEEHPRGLLSKPCQVCGYKYGTKWLHEDVPGLVMLWLAGLPEADIPLPAAWARS